MMTDRSGIEQHNRILLETLHQNASGPFTVAEAGKMLGLDEVRTGRLLPYLAHQGWLARVKRGLYIVVPLGASAPREWREDPWVVAASTFAPCYISGWSACEHWGLTEQIFRDIIVISAAPLRDRLVTIQETPFRLKHLPLERHFGTKSIWRGQNKILIADPSRAIVDILDDPGLGGGIKHVAEILLAYFASEHRSDSLLLEYTKRLGNRSVYKRLGHLLEALEIEAPEVLHSCKELESSGISLLDPDGVVHGPIQKRWNLRVNVAITKGTNS